MENLCDHTSVGVIIEDNIGRILLLNRSRYPYGLAAPAGHVDNHGSLQQTAIEEVKEEVGLILELRSLKKAITDRKIANQCRRTDGDHHTWNVFIASNFSGQLLPSREETLGAKWFSKVEIAKLKQPDASEEVKRGDQVLENVWLSFFKELEII